MPDHVLDEGQRALLELLRRLDAGGYDFVTITPASHGRIFDREQKRTARDLRDLLGWSLPARPGSVDAEVWRLLAAADQVEARGDLVRSKVRASRVDGRLFLHSAYPTRQRDAVFLGPDTYRFVRFLRGALGSSAKAGRIVDIGAGAGVGGAVAAAFLPGSALQLTDVNPKALWLAAVNLAHAGIDARLVETSGLDGVEPGIDLAVANPPFMTGSSGRTYSAGGDMQGARLSLDWAEAALARLNPGGRLLMYTGSAIAAGGEDRLKSALEGLAADAGARLAYDEIDPDIFGEVLRMESYREVERIAAVGVSLSRPA